MHRIRVLKTAPINPELKTEKEVSESLRGCFLRRIEVRSSEVFQEFSGKGYRASHRALLRPALCERDRDNFTDAAGIDRDNT